METESGASVDWEEDVEVGGGAGLAGAEAAFAADVDVEAVATLERFIIKELGPPRPMARLSAASIRP
jgi:hypothetical protein